MKKKAISLLLVGAMVAAMVAGCGNASSNDNGAAAGGDSSAAQSQTAQQNQRAAKMDIPSQQTSGEQAHIRLTSSYMQMRKQQQLQGQKWM